MDTSSRKYSSFKTPRAGRATESQIDELVTYMENHNLFARGKFLGKDGKQGLGERWKALTDILNSVPRGTVKDSKQWQVKAANIRRQRNATGNKPITATPLTAIELRVLEVIGFVYVEGSACPDSLPEEESLQIQLEAGDVSVLQALPQTHILKDVATPTVLSLEVVDTEIGNHEKKLEVPPELENSIEGRVCSEIPSPRTPTQSSGSRQYSVKKRKTPSRERIGVQLLEAREKFTVLQEDSNKTQMMIGEAAKQQAEAAMLMAKAALQQAENGRLQNETAERLIGVIENQSIVMERFLTVVEKINKYLD
ncbi:uncharacterized protein [Anabrus simplex]|uniref:uncharacterized protein n=1 Tax=Anabrus simplex TaxID=316456 RepID=UPI0035A2A31C